MSAPLTPPHRLFVTATGTDCGKTWLTRGLARALARRGHVVAALKPIETGVDPRALDAEALAKAAERPELAHHPGFVREPLPLAPLAAAREAPHVLPPISEVADATVDAASGADVLLVEGAGGILVPYDERTSIIALARLLELPIALVGRDALGTLSHVQTAYESAERRGLQVRAVVLTEGPWSSDPSVRSNRELLGERLPVPILRFPSGVDDDDALAALAEPLLPVLYPGLDEAPR